MNFDDMKSAWKSDQGKDIVLPTAIDKIKSAGMPIDKIRKLMLGEFCLQVPAVIAIFFLPSVFKLQPVYYLPYYCLYTVFVLICVYYLLKFYLFYRRLNVGAVNSKDSLYALYYDVKLNIEMYKVFNYTLSPFCLIYFFMYWSHYFSFKYENLMQGTGNNKMFLTVFIGTSVLSVVLTFIFTDFYIKRYYGKYAAQIKSVLDELIEN